MVRAEPTLHQCDLLPALPVPILKDLPHPRDLGREETRRQPARPEFWNVMVLSQTCDIEQEKVDQVLLARYVELSKLSKSESQSGAKWRRKLRSGQLLPQLVLPPHAKEPTQDWSVVDFRVLVTLDLSYVMAHAASCEERLRIKPEFRHAYIGGFSSWIARPDHLDQLADFDSTDS